MKLKRRRFRALKQNWVTARSSKHSETHGVHDGSMYSRANVMGSVKSGAQTTALSELCVEQRRVLKRHEFRISRRAWLRNCVRGKVSSSDVLVLRVKGDKRSDRQHQEEAARVSGRGHATAYWHASNDDKPRLEGAVPQ